MPEPAINGTYPHPGIPGSAVTAGAHHVVPWLQQHLGRPRSLAVDIETYGLGADMLRQKAVVLAVPDAVLLLDPRQEQQAHWLAQALEYSSEIVVHTASADVPSLVRNGIMRPGDIRKVYDTVVAARLAMPGETTPKTLEACAARYLGIKSGKMGDVFKTIGLTKTAGYVTMDIDSPAYLFGAAADGLVTARLRAVVARAAYDRLTQHPFPAPIALTEDEAWAECEKWQRVNRLKLRRTVRGLRIDRQFLEDYRIRTGRELDQQESQLLAAGIDPGNGNQLADHLDRAGELPADHPRTPTGKPSTKAKHLEQLNSSIARTFTAAKKTRKVLDDYLVKCSQLADADDRIHPTVSVLGAVHGRYSMSDPPLHQFPGSARGIIMADRGDELASVDWAQQEPVVALNTAGDVEALIDYEQHGAKLYDAIARFGKISYKVAKIVLLAGMYGEGLRKLSADLGLDPGPWAPKTGNDGRYIMGDDGNPEMFPTYKAARELQDAAFSAIPKTRALLDDLRSIGVKHKVIYTLNGRIIPIPSGVQPWDGKWSVQGHKPPNFYISGSSADMMTDALLAVEAAGLAEALYIEMHDEMVVSASAAQDVARIMQTPSPRMIRLFRRTPVIRTDIAILGERWSDA